MDQTEFNNWLWHNSVRAGATGSNNDVVLVSTLKEFFKDYELKPRTQLVGFNSDTFRLRQCINHNNGIFPAQLRESGVMFWDGARVTIEDFRNECDRQGYTFKVK